MTDCAVYCRCEDGWEVKAVHVCGCSVGDVVDVRSNRVC